MITYEMVEWNNKFQLVIKLLMMIISIGYKYEEAYHSLRIFFSDIQGSNCPQTYLYDQISSGSLLKINII